MKAPKAVQAAIKDLPHKPGVYTFKDAQGTPLYIGKAKDLRKRVISYTRFKQLPAGKAQMVLKSKRLDHIVVNTEDEALLLENTLIKQHRPRYNVMLKDDKNFRYICIDVSEDYPRVSTVRRITDNGAHYYGPYVSGGALNRTLRLLARTFQVRDCTIDIADDNLKSFLKRPCLKFDLGRCTAPCIAKPTDPEEHSTHTQTTFGSTLPNRPVSREEYAEQVRQLESFLKGDTKQLIKEIEDKMYSHSQNKEYERAGKMRDRIRDIKKLIGDPQDVVNVPLASADILAITSNETGSTVARLVIRNKTLIARETYELRETDTSNPAEAIEAFILQFYASLTQLPSHILVNEKPENSKVLEAWLAARAHELDSRLEHVRIIKPTRGARRRLVTLAKKNAVDTRKRLTQRQASEDSGLERLQEALDLQTTPERIECIDVSHVQGSEPVASLVVFEHGKPAKDQYRLFKIKDPKAVDDTRRMHEVLTRRFSRHGKDAKQQEAWPLPDLLVLDGGKPQLSAGLQALADTNVLDLPTITLAKKEEEIFLAGADHPLVLPHTDPGLRILMQCRDEAHRFAIGLHRKRRSKTSTKSILDTIPGIGPKTKKDLLKTFGSIKGIRDASDQELEKLIGPDKTERLRKEL